MRRLRTCTHGGSCRGNVKSDAEIDCCDQCDMLWRETQCAVKDGDPLGSAINKHLFWWLPWWCHKTWRYDTPVCLLYGQQSHIQCSKGKKCVQHHKYLSYFHKTNTSVFSVILVTKRAKLHLANIVVAKVSLFGYVIYSSVHAHC